MRGSWAESGDEFNDKGGGPVMRGAWAESGDEGGVG